MDQQNKTKSEENQNKPTELSDKDLEQVSGGVLKDTVAPAVESPRDSASRQATDSISNTGSMGW